MWGQGEVLSREREGLERETGKGGGGASGLLPLLCGFLYTPGRLGACLACLPARLGKWVTEGRSSAHTLAKEHPATARPENTFLLQLPLPLF